MARRQKLTDKQQVFLEEYLQTWNATHAARLAGYAYPNVDGPKLLVNPSIRSVIQSRLSEKTMSANEVLERLGQQARGDIALFLTTEERPHPDPEQAKQGAIIEVTYLDVTKASKSGYSHLIKSISYTNNGPKIELYSSYDALVKIGEHYKLFTQKTEVSGPNGGPIPVEHIIPDEQVGSFVKAFAEIQNYRGTIEPLADGLSE
jgi:phage terminase small subunit